MKLALNRLVRETARATKELLGVMSVTNRENVG